MFGKPAKNMLQEILQKNRAPLPIYRTMWAEETTGWVSVVELHGIQEGFRGSIMETKREAEETAAVIALKFLGENENYIPCRLESISSIVVAQSPKLDDMAAIRISLKDAHQRVPTVILIDVENVAFMMRHISEIMSLNLDNLYAYAFVGMHHDLSQSEWSGITKVISPSTRKDGTDTCIQMHMGVFLNRDQFRRYLIATKDHFAYVLVDMAQTGTDLWSRAEAEAIPNATLLVNALIK